MQYKNKRQRFFIPLIDRCRPLFLIIILLFTLGVFFGTMGVDTLTEENVNRLTDIVDKFEAGIPQLNADPPGIVQKALTDNLVTWAVLFFLGLTVIGIPMVLILIFMRGFTLGFAISFLAKQKSGAGTLLAITAIAPHNLILLPALFLSGAAALSFALILVQRFFNTRVRVLPGFLGYTVVMLTAGILFSGAAVIEAYVSPWLTRTASNLLSGNWSLPF